MGFNLKNPIELSEEEGGCEARGWQGRGEPSPCWNGCTKREKPFGAGEVKLCRLGQIFGEAFESGEGCNKPSLQLGVGGCSFDKGLQGIKLVESLKSRLIVRQDKTQHRTTAVWELLVYFHLPA